MRIGLGSIPLVALSLVLAACAATEPVPPAEPAEQPTASPPVPGQAPTSSPPAATTPTTPPSTTAPGGRPAGWGPQACPAAANPGFAVGQTLGDLGVRDCETGAPASVSDTCGAKATWIFAAHTHCPTCRSTAGFTDEVANAVASKDVAVVHLVYDDNGTSCAEWKAAYKLAGLTNVYVYDDPKGVAFDKLKAESYTAPSVFLDKNRVVTFKEHGLSRAQVLEQIDSALAK